MPAGSSASRSFRSETLPGAFGLLAGMAGLNGFALPDMWLAKWGAAGQWLQSTGLEFSQSRGLVTGGLVNWIVILLGIAWFAPNTQQIMARFEPAIAMPKDLQPAVRLAWRPTAFAAVIVAVAGLAAIFNLHQKSEFLYFQF